MRIWWRGRRRGIGRRSTRCTAGTPGPWSVTRRRGPRGGGRTSPRTSPRTRGRSRCRRSTSSAGWRMTARSGRGCAASPSTRCSRPPSRRLGVSWPPSPAPWSGGPTTARRLPQPAVAVTKPGGGSFGCASTTRWPSSARCSARWPGSGWPGWVRPRSPRRPDRPRSRSMRTGARPGPTFRAASPARFRLDGLSLSEIAGKTGWTHQQAKHNWRTAKVALNRALADTAPADTPEAEQRTRVADDTPEAPRTAVCDADASPVDTRRLDDDADASTPAEQPDTRPGAGFDVWQDSGPDTGRSPSGSDGLRALAGSCQGPSYRASDAADDTNWRHERQLVGAGAGAGDVRDRARVDADDDAD